MKPKQLLKNFKEEESEILRKFGEVFYLSGSMMCEGKTARQTFASVSRRFPEYLDFSYDARFFGLLSSQMEAVFSRMAEKNYTQQQYNVKKLHPVHHARRLSDSYRNTIKTSVDDGSLGEYKLDTLTGEILSITAVPVKLSTAWGLYMAYHDKEKPNEVDVEESKEPVLVAIEGTINESSVNTLQHQIKNEYNWIIDQDDFRITKNSNSDYDFYFSVKKDGIRQRYDYLTITRDYVESVRADFENVENETDAINLLLTNVKGEFPQLEKNRVNHLQNLLKTYGNSLAEEYVESTLTKINEISRNYVGILESYHKILDDLLGTLADCSYASSKDEMIRVNVSVLPKIPFVRPTITTSSVHVPDSVKEKVSKKAANGKWHYGLDWHTLHIPQILERLYLIEKGYPERVSSSLLRRND